MGKVFWFLLFAASTAILVATAIRAYQHRDVPPLYLFLIIILSTFCSVHSLVELTFSTGGAAAASSWPLAAVTDSPPSQSSDR